MSSPTADLIEIKVVVSALVTLLASVALAVLNAVMADSTILGGLHPTAQFIALAAIPPVATALAGYLKTSNRV